ncbi:helix-turn-helix domain-containing protein [Nonomuraea sp. NPDC046802]|uniref:helix-turn-helix domain-containing protein n=1 Tax=Nonomuraea sp. NPDC046802 TaxID=3154919 RepID=UPI0033D80E12
MTWQKLTKRQQDFARQLSARIPHTQCPQASVSQVAKHLDAVADAARQVGHGPIDGDTLKALCQVTGWTYTAPKRSATVKDLAAALGVSLSTIYRRCRNGLLDAVKVAGRWVITVTA